MRSLTKGHVKNAFSSLRAARARSFLTMFGIIVGVVSVIMVVGIGEGIKQQVGGQIKHYGNDLVTVRPKVLRTGGANGLDVLSELSVTGSLTSHDLTAVAKSKHVRAAVPMTILSGSVKGPMGSYKSGAVIGTSPDWPLAMNRSIAYGAFFSDNNDGDNVAVLGQHTADKMFDEDVPLGRSFTLRGQTFIVIGILNEFNAAPLSGEADFNNAIFVPYSTAEDMADQTAPIYEILAKPTAARDTDAMIASMRSNLTKVHGGQPDFTILKENENLVTTNAVLNLLTGLVTGVAAISLFVGGVGIMNVMLVSVTERMHEIGVRKAIGATNRQILTQFLVEATVLSLAGGIIGIALSFLADYLVRLATDLKPVIGWQIVVLATGVSLLVGIVFGTAPALKAARRHPIDALRSE